MKIRSLDIIIASAFLLIVATSFAHTWQKTSGNFSYGDVRMSADGRIICAVNSNGYPAISTDAGQTWYSPTNLPFPSVLYPGEAAMSADGGRIFSIMSTNILTSTSFYLSTDHATNWTKTGFPNGTYDTYSPIACSADGSVVVAAVGSGPIFYSTNGGVNCYTSSVPNADWLLASSADGRRIIAAQVSGGIYYSTNFGVTWILNNRPTNSWKSVCISSDGQSVGASSATATYISHDFGATWATNQISGREIVCSADGTTWLLVSSQIYTSTNGGATWQSAGISSSQWSAGAMSADGSEAAVMGTQGIWLGLETLAPRLKVQVQDSTLALSWVLPTTNLMVQQVDLSTGNWQAITNNPVSNFTNVQQEIRVPLTNSSGFYRLISQ